MTTLAELWKKYRDACYPPDMPAEQNWECHQAFMAGAFSACAEIQIISATVKAEGEATKQIGALCQEAEKWCEMRVKALEAPRN